MIMGEPDVWPVMLEMSRDDCKRILRRLELEAYSNLVSVLRAQGSLTVQKRRLLQNVAQTLGISEERHKAECRRAVNSEKLATIAKHMGGANSGTEWAIEGRRLVPLLPRLVPQTAFTAIADKVANMAMTEGAKLPLPTPPIKKRLSSPPIDESLLEPSVPEASKTPQMCSGSPLLLSIPIAEISEQTQPFKSLPLCSAESTQSSQVSPLHSVLPTESHESSSSGACPEATPFSAPVLPSPDLTPCVQIKEEIVDDLQFSQSSSLLPVLSNSVQSSGQTSQNQPVHKSQVVLLVKKDDRTQDMRPARKRPRSASLDVPLNISGQGSMMPPPVKKEAISPLSPHSIVLNQPSTTMSPQSHSQFVQQQTLQAAAAAVAFTASSPSSQHQQLSQQVPPELPPPPQKQQQQKQPQQKQQRQLQHQKQQQQKQQKQQQLIQQITQHHQPSPPQPAQHTTVSSQSQQHQQSASAQQNSNLPSNVSQASTPSPSPSGRTITIPSQGTVKLSLSSTTSSSSTGIPSGTHKVIIVSSTTPSILQRSLSVPVVKSLSTSAPSQPCSSTLVLNTAQQSQQVTTTASSSCGSADTTPSSTSIPALTSTLPSKLQGKIISQSTPKSRPRANSIVIPVTPNQANVMNSVGVTSVQLKSALQAGKQGVPRSTDTAGLKIMPLANINANAKLLPKSSGSGPMYVVSTTSAASSTVSMVARTVSTGQRVMTFTTSGPKVTVSASQGGNTLSKPMQTLQFTQSGSVVTSSGTIPLSSASGKPNVIVVQKGSSFGRGVTLSHGGKEVVGKVLLGGKALTSLNQNQIQNQTAANLSSNATSNSNALAAQVLTSQASQSSTQVQPSQNLLPTTTPAPTTRVVTVQKLPSAVVQGSSGSSNVIVLDLSQEQLNNSAVLNEILASSILQSSNVMTFNHGGVGEADNTSISSLKGLINFPSQQNDCDSGLLVNADGNILVEGLDHSVAFHSEDSAAEQDSSMTSENSAGFDLDNSSFHGGQSSNGSRTQSSRGHTDICATAISNANLNLNDFLDDSSLDDVEQITLEEMKMDIKTGMGHDQENNSIHANVDESFGNMEENVGNWVPDNTPTDDSPL